MIRVNQWTKYTHWAIYLLMTQINKRKKIWWDGENEALKVRWEESSHHRQSLSQGKSGRQSLWESGRAEPHQAGWCIHYDYASLESARNKHTKTNTYWYWGTKSSEFIIVLRIHTKAQTLFLEGSWGHYWWKPSNCRYWKHASETITPYMLHWWGNPISINKWIWN